MKRRTVLNLCCVSSTLGIAGCIESSTPGSNANCTINTAGDIDPINIRADGKLPDAEVTVDICWNARVKPTLDDDGDPPTGDLWLVVIANVSNPSHKDVQLGNFDLTTETPDIVRENTANGVNIIGDSEYINRQLDSPALKPGGSIQDLLFYGIVEKSYISYI